MTLPIKSILNCLVILAMTSDIQTKQIRALKTSKELVKGANLVWGSGVEPSQLPIVTYSTDLSYINLNIDIIQPKKKCFAGFSYSSNIKWVGIHTIKQFAGNKVVFIWSVITDTSATKSTILDMDTCKYVKDFDEGSIPATGIAVVVVPFTNGFDAFTSENDHKSYDPNGNIVGSLESFPINSDHFSIDPVSVKSNTNGFFIADYEKATLTRVNVHGKLMKHLLKSIPAEVFTNNEQSSYSVCWFDAERVLIRCFQYDDAGNEKWRNQKSLGFRAGALHVKNLAGGRLVFAAWNYIDKQLYIVEMGRKQVNIWSYLAKHPFQTAKLMDFNEKDHTFTLAYTPIVLGTSERSLLLQKFSFVS